MSKKYKYKSCFGLRVLHTPTLQHVTNQTGNVNGHPKTVVAGKKSEPFTLVQFDTGDLEVVSICDLIPIACEWPRKFQSNSFWEKEGT